MLKPTTNTKEYNMGMNRAQITELLAEVLDLDTSDIKVIKANDDGDVRIDFEGLFLDDVDDADEDDSEDDEDEDDTEDEVEADANDVSEPE